MKKTLFLLVCLLVIGFTKKSYSQVVSSCTITVGTLTPVTYCAGGSISVPWTTSGGSCPITKNVFLSDASGNFASAVNIGSGTASPIVCTIPTTIAAGTGYRVRVGGATQTPSSQDLTINAAPTVSVSPSSVTVCIGAPTNLTASGAVTYNWSPSTDLSGTTGTTVTVTSSATGVVNYTVVGTDGNGCTNKAYSNVTTSTSAGALDAGPDQNICTTSLDMQATGATNYSWSPAAYFTVTTGSSVTANFPGIGTYTVTVTGTSGSCAPVTDDVIVTVTTGITVTAGMDATICSGASTKLTATGGSTYSWLPSEGLSATSGAVVTASPTTTTDYTVTSVSGPCSSSDVVRVVVSGVLPTLLASPDLTLCSGEAAILTAGYAADGNTYSWSPSFSGLASTLGANVILAILPTMSTPLYITASNASCSAIDTVNIQLNAGPSVGISPSNNIQITAGTPVNITANGADTYTWSPSTYLSATTGDVVVCTPTGDIVYTVTGKFSATGCTSQATVTVSVSTGIGVGAANESAIIIFPNPFKENTQIVFKTAAVSFVQLEVFDLLGQKIQTLVNEKLPAGEHKYNFSAKQTVHSSGVYFVKLRVDNKTSVSRIVELE